MTRYWMEAVIRVNKHLHTVYKKNMHFNDLDDILMYQKAFTL